MTKVSRPPRRVFYLENDLVLTTAGDGRVTTSYAPEGAYEAGWGALLARMSAALDPRTGGVVLLGAGAARRAGWPEDELPEPLPAEGWTAYGQAGWFTYTRKDAATVRVGLVDRMRPDQAVLVAKFAGDTVARFDRWHRLMGAPFYGTPGTAATLALQITRPQGRGRPAWRMPEHPEEWHGAEADYDGWTSPDVADATELVGFDRIRAGLCTWIAMEVCPWALKRRETTRFDRAEAGMWRVSLAPWNEKRVPPPWGPQELEADPHTDRWSKPVWRATPTLTLLEDLERDGVYGGFRVTEAYTGHGRRLFRDWATGIRTAWDDAPITDPEADAGEPEALRAALKGGYRQAHGLIKRQSKTGIYRVDWWNIHTATSRSVAWRRMWEATKQDAYPAWMDGDCVGYEPHSAPRDVFPMRDEQRIAATDRLGNWRATIVNPRTRPLHPEGDVTDELH